MLLATDMTKVANKQKVEKFRIQRPNKKDNEPFFLVRTHIFFVSPCLYLCLVRRIQRPDEMGNEPSSNLRPSTFNILNGMGAANRAAAAAAPAASMPRSAGLVSAASGACLSTQYPTPPVLALAGSLPWGFLHKP